MAQYGNGSIELTKFEHILETVKGRNCVCIPIDGLNNVRGISYKEGRCFLNFNWKEMSSQYSTHIINPMSTKEERDAKNWPKAIGGLTDKSVQQPATGQGWGASSTPTPSPSPAPDPAPQQSFGGAKETNGDLPF